MVRRRKRDVFFLFFQVSRRIASKFELLIFFQFFRSDRSPQFSKNIDPQEIRLPSIHTKTLTSTWLDSATKAGGLLIERGFHYLILVRRLNRREIEREERKKDGEYRNKRKIREIVHREPFDFPALDPRDLSLADDNRQIDGWADREAGTAT